MHTHCFLGFVSVFTVLSPLQIHITLPSIASLSLIITKNLVPTNVSVLSIMIVFLWLWLLPSIISYMLWHQLYGYMIYKNPQLRVTGYRTWLSEPLSWFVRSLQLERSILLSEAFLFLKILFAAVITDANDILHTSPMDRRFTFLGWQLSLQH